MLIEEGYISLPYSPRMTEEQMRVTRDTSDAKRFRDALAFVRAREGGRCAMSSIGNGCQGMDLERCKSKCASEPSCVAFTWTPSLHKSAQVCDLGVGAAACWLHSSSFNGAPVVSSHGSRERCFIERPEAQSVDITSGRRLQESVFTVKQGMLQA